MIDGDGIERLVRSDELSVEQVGRRVIRADVTVRDLVSAEKFKALVAAAGGMITATVQDGSSVRLVGEMPWKDSAQCRALADQFDQAFGTSDPVHRPAHYRAGDPYETIKVIEAWELDFCLGNAVKYISRAGRKDAAKTIEDLEKARWYLDRRIAQLRESAR